MDLNYSQKNLELGSGCYPEQTVNASHMPKRMRKEGETWCCHHRVSGPRAHVQLPCSYTGKHQRTVIEPGPTGLKAVS